MATILAVDIGGTKLAAGRVDERRPARGPRRRGPRPPGDDGEAVLGRAARPWSTRCGTGDEVACGVGCGGPMTGGGDARLAAQHPGVAGLPAPRPARGRAATCRSTSTTTPRRWRSARAGSGAAAGERGLHRHGRVHRRRRRHRARRPAARRRRRQRRPHRPRDRGARRAARARAARTGCLEAEASGTAIAARTGRPPARGRRAPSGTAPGGWSAGRVASVANLLDLRLAVVAGSVALGFGDDVLRRRPGRARPLRPPRLLRRRPDRARPASAPTGPLVGAAAVALRGPRPPHRSGRPARRRR